MDEAAPHPAPAPAETVGDEPPPAPPALPWLLMLALLLVGALVWWGYDRSGVAVSSRLPPVQAPAAAPSSPAVPETLPGPPTPPSPPAAPVPAALHPARLSLGNIDGKVVYAGSVGDEAERNAILGVLGNIFGPDNMAGEISLDRSVRPAPWLARLEPALRDCLPPRGELQLDGSSARLGGLLEPEEQSLLRSKLQDLYGDDIKVTALSDGADSQFREAKARALAALSALPTGFSATALIGALNLAIFDFESGSPALSDESRDLLRQMAAAIRAAPAGSVIEIGGHTDYLGDDAANMALSQNRAEAVCAELIARGVDARSLRARGYGEQRPVADNATFEGRAQNRRITFALTE